VTKQKNKENGVYVGEVCTEVWWGDLMERDHWEEKSPKWNDNIKSDLQDVG